MWYGETLKMNLPYVSFVGLIRDSTVTASIEEMRRFTLGVGVVPMGLSCMLFHTGCSFCD